MKKKLLAGLACGLVMGVAGVAGATTIVYSYSPTGLDGASLTSPYALTLADFHLETFDKITTPEIVPSSSAQLTGADQTGWSWSSVNGGGSVVNGYFPGLSANPDQTDLTNYLSVPNPFGGSTEGSVSVSLGQEYSYFGIYWGSIDTYNDITFYLNGVKVAAWAGGARNGWADSYLTGSVDANGNQTDPPSNVYVNFLDLPQFDSFTLHSAGRAFEVDNIAVGNPVPEPATMLLMGTGLAGLIAANRRRKAYKG